MITEPVTLGQLVLEERRRRGESATLTGQAIAKVGKRPKPWSYQMINSIEKGERGITAPLAKDIGVWLGIGEEVALLLAGYMPWLPTVEQAQKLAALFGANGERGVTAPEA